MPMPLQDVLNDPTVVAAEPVVLAGAERLNRSVTWVHTSEVLDVASLLGGGELLLVGGVSLAVAGPDERVVYIRELAERGAAGIAIETGSRLASVPPEMVDEADRVGLPLIQLRRVVRFVEVTQAINSLLVNESVRRLQLVDQISHALALGLADGASLPQIMEILAMQAQADTKLTAPDGEVLAQVQAVPGQASPFPAAQSVVAPVSSAGVTVALLTLTPRPGTNLLLLDAALDRAPESLSVAMLRFRPPSRVERDTHELLDLVRAGTSRLPRRFVELADRLGISRYDAWVTTVARLGPGQSLTTGIEAAVGQSDRTIVSQIDQGLHTCIIALRLSRTTLAAARQSILAELRAVALAPRATVAVGPGTRSIHGISRCLVQAKATLDLTDEAHPVVADSIALGVTRLVADLDRDELVAAFIDEQIGDVIASDQERRTCLFDTLALYLRHSANKTETAAALHLQRQTLYQRLNRISSLLGEPPPGGSRWAAIMLAVELETARRQLAGQFLGLKR